MSKAQRRLLAAVIFFPLVVGLAAVSYMYGKLNEAALALNQRQELKNLAHAFFQMPHQLEVLEKVAKGAGVFVSWGNLENSQFISTDPSLSAAKFLEFPEVLAAKNLGEGYSDYRTHHNLALKQGSQIIHISKEILRANYPRRFFLTYLFVLGVCGGAYLFYLGMDQRKREKLAQKCSQYLTGTELKVLPDLDVSLERLSKGYRRLSLEHSVYKEKATTILNSIPAGMIVMDMEGSIVFINGVARNLLRIKEENVVGRMLEELTKSAGIIQFVRDNVAQDHIVAQDVGMYHEGKEWILRAVFKSAANTNPPLRLLLLEDVTSEKQQQRKRQDYIANASHELKTPLTVIKGYLYTLLEAQKEPSTAEFRFLKKMDVQVDRLVKLTEDLLDLAQDKDLTKKTELAELDLKAELIQMVDVFKDLAHRKQIGIDSDLQASVRIYASRSAFQEIISNLIDNAIKYTLNEGRVLVSLKKVGAEARIQVRDTGIGIPSMELKRIFERFYRVDKAHSNIEGFGLGLSIVELHVKELGGRIEVESKVGQGTVFTLHFPCIDEGL